MKNRGGSLRTVFWEDKMIEGLADVGNFEGCVSKSRIVRPEEILTTPQLLLKFYTMIERDSPLLPSETIGVMREFINRERDGKRIKPCSGLGLAILSEGVLNIVKWENTNPPNPPIIKQDIYTYDPAQMPTGKIKRISLDKEGTFCLYELAIVSHEKNAFHIFLDSGRSNRDKEVYLQESFSGEV